MPTACIDRETAPAIALHHDSKARHHRQRDLDIRFGDQFAHHLDLHRTIQQRQSHQQAGEELAGYIATNLRGIARQFGRRYLQRRKTFIAQIFDVRTKLAQGIHQIADGALVHARYTGQFVTATGQGQRRRQRTERGTRVAEEKLRLFDGKIPATTGNAIGVIAKRLHLHAECAQGIQHAFGIVGVQQVAHCCRALRQRSQQQHAVGDALGTGQAHAAVRGHQRREFEGFVLSHAIRICSYFCVQALRTLRASLNTSSSFSASLCSSA